MITGRVGSGADVTPAFEGWFKDPDGAIGLLFGYYNRNENEASDIPIGPNNHFEPGDPDRGQPTYYLPKRLSPGYLHCEGAGRFWGAEAHLDFDRARKTNAIPVW